MGRDFITRHSHGLFKLMILFDSLSLEKKLCDALRSRMKNVVWQLVLVFNMWI